MRYSCGKYSLGSDFKTNARSRLQHLIFAYLKQQRYLYYNTAPFFSVAPPLPFQHIYPTSLLHSLHFPTLICNFFLACDLVAFVGFASTSLMNTMMKGHKRKFRSFNDCDQVYIEGRGLKIWCLNIRGHFNN